MEIPEMPKVKYTIVNLQEYALQKNGRLISKIYTTASENYEWYCNKHEYQWSMKWTHVRQGRWCRKCSKIGQYDINSLHAYAKKNGGTCLSKEFSGVLGKYEWKCGQCSHQWRATFSTMYHNNTWCNKCSSKSAAQKRIKQFDLEVLTAFAGNKNGELLTEKYKGTKYKYLWKCKKHNYEWSSSWEKIKAGRWCPKCGRESVAKAASYTIKDMHEIAKKFRGQFLEEEYRGISEKHWWKCAEGHKF